MNQMESFDIANIENELRVKLPSHYISFILAYKSNGFEFDNFLYTDPAIMIQMNRLVGFYGEDKIIKKRLIIGDNGGGDYYLINLEDQADRRVYVYDHEESVEKSYNKESQTWQWESVESYSTLENYKTELNRLFGE
jgi:hypothetical protein